MKLYVLAATIFASLSIAAPSELLRRQDTSNELIGGGWFSFFSSCKPIIFIFARGSTESGNMGDSVGPLLCKALKHQAGETQVACQGVGGDYTATIPNNLLSNGTSEASWKEAMNMFQTANNCRRSRIIAGGYSQGTAVMMNAISRSSTEIKDKIKGTVLFGYTQNRQTQGTIPNYPKDRLKVFCTVVDGVCDGTLIVTPGHYAYSGDSIITEASQFLLKAART